MKMKRFEIEKDHYLKIMCTNGFIVEGFMYNEFWIEWWIYNVEYGIKQHLFTVEKDFNIKKYLNNNYSDICDDYLERFGDLENDNI